MRKPFTHALLIACFVLAAGSSYAQDGIIINFGIGQYLKTNTNYALSVNVQNQSAIKIPSVAVGWRLDKGTTHKSVVYTITGGLPLNYYATLPLSPSLNVTAERPHTLTVWCDATGEIDRTNDTIVLNFTAITNSAPKVVLLEEFTAQWCPHCPPAGAMTDTLGERYYVALARFHDTDSLIFVNGTSYMWSYFPGGQGEFPSGVVEMSQFGNYPETANYNTWPTDLSNLHGVSPVALDVTPVIDPSTRNLTATVTANFKYAEAGDYYLNVYITESGIKMHQIQENGSNIIKYTHNDVMRAMLGGVNGTGGVIPGSPVINTDYTKTYNYIIPANWNLSELKIIGIISKKENGERGAINAAKAGITYTAVNNVAAESNVTVYPNPFTQGVTISLPSNNKKVSISIFSIDGKLILSNDYFSPNESLYVDLGDKNMAPGFYTMILRTEDNIYSRKLVKY